MPLKLNRPVVGAVLAAAVLASAPALADVKAGVDAWSRGDYTAAVSEWRGPAEAGDPDAMFNLAQAYRLGRGVAADLERAEALYARAAAAGHIQAADTYGLMLFQDGRREAALPYVEDAARRGDPRSQYLLGVAHFNGDIVPKDWVRAYALVTLANAAGLPQAAPALAEMDGHIPLADRQHAAALAERMRVEADAARGAQLTAVELAARDGAGVARSVPSAAPTATAVSPSIAAALAAVAEASRATGTESPANAGASFARAPAAPQRTARSAAPAPTQVAQAQPRPRSAPTAPASGSWRVQLGAFSVEGNARRLWEQLSGRSELADKQRLMIEAGAVTKLQAGGYASRSAADAACSSLKRSGHDCLVTRR